MERCHSSGNFATFLDLSNEILISIFEELNILSPRHLRAHRLVSRRLDAIITPIVYRHFNLGAKWISAPDDPPRKEAIAKINAYTRHLSLAEGNFSSHWAGQMVARLVSGCQRLESLTWACQALDRNVAYDGMPYVYQELPSSLRKIIVEKFPSLRLYIERFNSDTRISSSIPLPNVRGLRMIRHEGPDPNPEFFYNMKNLEALEVQVYSDFEFDDFEHGRKLPPIKELKIGQRTYMAGVSKDLWDLSRLESLEVSDMYSLDLPSLGSASAMFRSMPPKILAGLKVLKYTIPFVASDPHIKFPINVLDDIKALSVFHLITDFDSLDMTCIGRHGDTLEELDLGQITEPHDQEFACSVLAVPDLEILQQSCWRLQRLAININLKGTDMGEALSVLAKFPSLQTLTLRIGAVRPWGTGRHISGAKEAGAGMGARYIEGVSGAATWLRRVKAAKSSDPDFDFAIGVTRYITPLKPGKLSKLVLNMGSYGEKSYWKAQPYMEENYPREMRLFEITWNWVDSTRATLKEYRGDTVANCVIIDC